MLIKSTQAVRDNLVAVPRMLETEEAARRLGVKRATLYAYVSRGLLDSHRAPGGGRSLFDATEVERLARRSRAGRETESRLASVTTSVTQLHDDSGPSYRGRPAVELAGTCPYEDVAELLWGSDATPWRPWTGLALDPPAELDHADRLRWALVMCGARDPLRADHRPDAVRGAARALIASMVDVLAAGGGTVVPLVLPDGHERPGALAASLAAGLCPNPTVDVVRAVNAALVLLADHELATSTVAVRVAASTRADLYDAVAAGLGTVAGPLHGGASLLAVRFLLDAERLGPARAFDETLRWHTHVPGFGHAVYRRGDRRFAVLRHAFEALATAEQRRVLDALVALAEGHAIPEPNVDLGLAAVVWATGMAEDAGRTLFTVARVAGWTAHYLEELDERALRFRARAVYAVKRERVVDGS